MSDIEKILSDTVVSKVGEEFDKVRAEITLERAKALQDQVQVQYKQLLDDNKGLETPETEAKTEAVNNSESLNSQVLESYVDTFSNQM